MKITEVGRKQNLWMRRKELFYLNSRTADMRQRQLCRLKTVNKGKRQWMGLRDGGVKKKKRQLKNGHDRNYRHSFLCPNLTELNVCYYKQNWLALSQRSLALIKCERKVCSSSRHRSTCCLQVGTQPTCSLESCNVVEKKGL